MKKNMFQEIIGPSFRTARSAIGIQFLFLIRRH